MRKKIHNNYKDEAVQRMYLMIMWMQTTKAKLLGDLIRMVYEPDYMFSELERVALNTKTECQFGKAER